MKKDRLRGTGATKETEIMMTREMQLRKKPTKLTESHSEGKLILPTEKRSAGK